MSGPTPGKGCYRVKDEARSEYLARRWAEDGVVMVDCPGPREPYMAKCNWRAEVWAVPWKDADGDMGRVGLFWRDRDHQGWEVPRCGFCQSSVDRERERRRRQDAEAMRQRGVADPYRQAMLDGKRKGLRQGVRFDEDREI